MKAFANILRIVALGLLLYVKFYQKQWLAIPGLNQMYIRLLFDFLIFLLSLNLLIVLLTFWYKKRNKLGVNEYDNVTIGLSNVYYIILTAAVIFTILGFFGIDPKTLFTSLSIVAAAIAIVSKEFLSEVISGIILSFSKEIAVGDYLKIGEHKGRIVDLKFTKVVFYNEDDDVVFIPNFTVFGSDIVNYTRNQSRKVNVEFEIMLDAIKNINELEQDLIQAVQEYHRHIERKSYNLKIEAIHKDYLSLKFQYKLLQNNDRLLEQEIRRATVRRVVDYVKSNYASK